MHRYYFISNNKIFNRIQRLFFIYLIIYFHFYFHFYFYFYFHFYFYFYFHLLLPPKGHWNQTVEGLAQSVLKMYMEMDPTLYDKCARYVTHQLFSLYCILFLFLVSTIVNVSFIFFFIYIIIICLSLLTA